MSASDKNKYGDSLSVVFIRDFNAEKRMLEIL